jgi:hypothetical protein
LSKRNPDFAALEIVHGALAPLDPETRGRVLSSVAQLLDVEGFSGAPRLPAAVASPSVQTQFADRPGMASRPLALIELLKEKNPGTIPETIATFAYYRERHEGKSTFSREDIRQYFSKAKLPPPGNYDRDFVNAVKRGWIHEDGSESYVTSRGVEAVESGYSKSETDGRGRGPRKSRKKSKTKKRPRA